MKLLEILEDERYKSAPPDQRETIIKDWYENTQKDPRFTPDLKSSIQKDIETFAVPTFREVSPTREPFTAKLSFLKPLTTGLLKGIAIGGMTSKQALESVDITPEEKQAVLGLANNVAKWIRWPFWRTIEHPISTVVTEAQKGQFNLGTIARATESLVPFRKVKQPAFYQNIWDNYWNSIVGTETPLWYKMMASLGTMAVVEPIAIRGVEKGAERLLTRPATLQEGEYIRKVFQPLKDNLQKAGIDSNKLNSQGNIIELSEKSDLYLNENVSAVLRGDQIRVPRWTKIKLDEPIKTELPITEPIIPQKAIDLQLQISKLRVQGKVAEATALQAQLDQTMGISAVAPTISPTMPVVAPTVPPVAPITPEAPVLPSAEIVSPKAPEPVKTKEEYDSKINQLDKQYKNAYKTGQVNKAADLWQELKLLRKDKNLHYPPEVKPTTIIGWIKTQGGINPQALTDYLGKDINWIKSNYPYFKTPGLLSTTGQKDLTELYTNAVTDRIILPLVNPESYTGGTGAYFLNQLKEGVGKKLEKVTELEEELPVEIITPDILDGFEERIQSVTTIEELKDIAEELKMELDDTNQGRIAQLFTLIDEQQKQLSIPTEERAEVQMVIPGAEPTMPTTGLQVPELIQQPIGGLFAPPEAKPEVVAPEVNAEAVITNSDWLNNLPDQIQTQWDNPDELYNLLKSVKEHELDFIDKSIFERFMEKIDTRLAVLSKEIVKKEYIKKTDDAAQLKLYKETNVLGPEETKEVNAKIAKLKANKLVSQKSEDILLIKYEIDEKDFEGFTTDMARAVLMAFSNKNFTLVNEHINELAQEIALDLIKSINQPSFVKQIEGKLGKEALEAMKPTVWGHGMRLAAQVIKQETQVHVPNEVRQFVKDNPKVTKEEFSQKFPKYAGKYDSLLKEILKINTVSLNQQVHSKENDEGASLQDILPVHPEEEKSWETDRATWETEARKALTIANQELSQKEWGLLGDFYDALKRRENPSQTPELAEIFNKLNDIADSLKSRKAQQKFMRSILGPIINNLGKLSFDQKGSVKDQFLFLGQAEKIEVALDKITDMLNIGGDKSAKAIKTILREFYNTPMGIAQKDSDFAEVFRLANQLLTYDKNYIENEVYEDKLQSFILERHPQFKEDKNILSTLIMHGTAISTKNTKLSRDSIRNIILMELKKYPAFLTDIFNTIDATQLYIQQVILPEIFRYNYLYYSPQKIDAELFMRVLKNVATFDKTFQGLYEGYKKLVFKSIDKISSILGSQAEMVKTYRAMLESKINFEVNRIPFYYAIQRYGYWALKAELRNKAGELVAPKYFKRSDSKREMLKEKERLIKEGYKVIYFGSIRELMHKSIDLIKDDINIFEFDELLRSAGLSEEELQGNDKNIEQVRNYILAKGFGRHWLHRTLATGYPTDYFALKKTLVQFIDGAVNSYSRARFRSLVRDEIAKIKNPNTKEYALEWYRNLTTRSYSSEFSRILDSFVTLWYLGWKATFGFMDLHQFFLTGYPTLEYYVPGKAEKIVGQTLALIFNPRYINMKAIKKSVDKGDELAQLLLRLTKEGVLRGSFSNELMGSAFRTGRLYQVANVVSIMAEHILWKEGAIAGYLAGKERGLTGEDLYRFLVKFDEEINFVYGAVNSFLWLGKQKGATKFAVRNAYKFRKFQHEYFQLVINKSRGRGDVLRRFVGMLWLIGGLSSFILWKAFWKLVRRMTGFDFERLLYQKVGKLAARILLSGPESAILGIDLSNLIGFGDLFGIRGGGGSRPIDPPDFWYLGSLGGIIDKSLYGSELLSRGETYRGLEQMTPRAIATLLRGARWWYQGGVTARTGEIISKLTPTEKIWGLLGFTPLSITERYAEIEAENEMKRAYQRRVEYINRNLAVGEFEGNEDRKEKAYRAAEEWNKYNSYYKTIEIDKGVIDKRLKNLHGIESSTDALRSKLFELYEKED